MPEATVDEDRQLGAANDDVGSVAGSGNLVVDSVAKSQPM
jgi:hypothetical protein